MWSTLLGGKIVVPDCGSIDVAGYSPEAAFFNQRGQRIMTTRPLDLRKTE